jgi:hypothetical protein
MAAKNKEICRNNITKTNLLERLCWLGYWGRALLVSRRNSVIPTAEPPSHTPYSNQAKTE